MTVQFDVFDVDDPNGTPLGTIDDTEAEALDFRVGYRGDPGEGHILINRHHSAAALIAPDRIYKAKIPVIDSGYLYAFIQKDADYMLATPQESGGETLELFGPGLKALFAQARLYWTVYAPGQTARGSANRAHNLWWWINEPYGAIATRVIEEGINQPGAPLADMNVTFTRTHDSDGVPWANIADEWQTNVGIDVLSVLSEMEQHGDFFIEVMPDLTVNAYQTSPGRDLTASVHVQKHAELMTSLRRRIHGRPAIDHLILEDSDGNYSLEVAPGASGRGNWGYYKAPTNDDTTLNKIGQDVIRASRSSLEPVEFEVDPLAYLPGPAGSASGDYWPADTILVSTGTGPQDYDEQAHLVTGLRFSLDPAVIDDDATTRARSLRVVVECNVETIAGVDPKQGFGGPIAPHSHADILCRPADPGTDSVLRLYPSNATGVVTPAMHSGWDTGTPDCNQWKATADGTYTGGGTGNTSNAGGDVAGINVAYRRGLYGPLSADEAALIAAGGMTVHGYTRVRAKSGIGISESSQNMVSNLSVRVTAGATTTIRGTALAPHTLASSAGSTKWRANTQHQNRLFPAEAASNVLSAVAACVAGDYLEIVHGSRNFTISSTNSGGAWLPCSDQTNDLPEDSVSVADLNCWLEFVASGIGADPGDLPQDTVLQGEANAGTSIRAARCDHEHSHGLLSPNEDNYHGIGQLANYVVHGSGAPAVTDDEGDGLRNGTHWIDDDTGDVYFLSDQTEGAAVWISLGGAGAAINAEDVNITDTGSYFTGTEVEAALQELGASIAGLGGISGIFGSGLAATFVGANNGAGGLTITVNKPAGTADGDLVIFGVFGHNVAPNAAGPAAGGGAWTERLRFDTDGNEWIAVYTKVASSEGASWTITTGSSSTTLSGAWAIVLRGPTTFVRSRYEDGSLYTGVIDGEPVGHQICIWLSALAAGTLFDITDPRITKHYANRMTAGEGAIMVASRPTTYIFPQPIFEATAPGMSLTWTGNLTMIFE